MHLSILALNITKWAFIIALVGVLVPIVAVFLSLLHRKPKAARNDSSGITSGRSWEVTEHAS